MSSPIHQSFSVPFSYPVLFTHQLFAPGNPTLVDVLASNGQGAPVKMLVVVDSGVARHHPNLLREVRQYARHHARRVTLVADPLILPGGEDVKNHPGHVHAVHEAIHQHKIDRHSFVLAIGGGAIIDAVGYAAATAHRGVRLIRVPTTVLSQNDSAVGVKNSVNAFGKKNFLGTFAPPYAVLNDLDFLTTLEDRDWLGGLSEAVKVALLKDPAFFAFLEEHATRLRGRDPASMEYAVWRCAQLHLEHIAGNGDPFEMGSSRPLDFGHWAAHKLESMTNFGLRHGEAVAIGIALDSTYAHLTGLLPESDWERIMHVFEQLGLAVYTPELEANLHTPGESHSVLAGLEEFREHLGGRLTIMLLEGIGRGVEVHDMNQQKLRESIQLLAQRHRKERHGQHRINVPAQPAPTHR